MTLNRLLPWLFAALAGPLCLFLALAVPTGEVPDERAHAVRADSLWHGEAIGHRQWAAGPDGRKVLQAGVAASPVLVAAASTFAPQTLAGKHATLDILAALDALQWEKSAAFVSAPNTAVYFPIVYIPTALGLAAGRAAGLGPYRSLLVARVVNAAAFIALGVIGLAVARAGQLVMFLALSLPMTVWLAGSVNPDGVLIATAALGAACLTRRAPGSLWPAGLAGLCLAVLGASKPAYLPMALAMAARPQSPYREPWSGWRQAASVWVVAAPGLIWAGVGAAFVAVPFVRPEYAPGPLWPGDPARMFRSTDVGAQLAVLAHGPWRLVTLPVRSMWRQARDQAGMTIGVLGLLDVVLPVRLYAAWLLAGVGAVLADLLGGAASRTCIERRGALAIVVGAFLSLWAIWILQYLSWTSVGATVIDGVQGRYYLPLLPFLGICLSAIRLPASPRLSALIACAPILVAAANAPLIAQLVVSAYYLR